MDLAWMGPGDEHLVGRAEHLFDAPIVAAALERFLAATDHHLAIATDDGRPLGFVSGVELIHPDKGTEMFLYELGVDEAARGRGVGTALVRALADRARERGCYGMWVLTDADNEAALRTYQAGGASSGTDEIMLDWTFGSR